MKTLLNNKLRTLTLVVAIFTVFATASGVAAATQYPSGGVWSYGATNGGAFSNFYHGSRYHSSTVISRHDADSSKAYARAGATSKAFLPTNFGEKVAFYYGFV